MAITSIDAVQFEDHHDHHLLHPVTREPLVMANGEPQLIRLMHPSAEPLKKLARTWRNERLQGIKLTAAIEEKRNVEYLVQATIDWQLEGKDGPIPFSEKTARQLYSDPAKDWIVRQLIVAQGDEGNYAILGESEAA